MRNIVRSFIALWYLLGWISHVYLGLFSPAIYRPLGDRALIPALTILWQEVILPNIAYFALLLAVFEIMVGLLLIGRGRWVKIGLGLSILFNTYLVVMGLGVPAADPLTDFMWNRLPNLVFIALQVPLFWGWDERSVPEAITAWISRAARPIKGT